MDNGKDWISIHQFLFPFRIDDLGSKPFDLSKWECDNSRWLKQARSIDCSHYGQYRYFHEKVGRLLWNSEPQAHHSFGLAHYQYQMLKATYQIKIDRIEDGNIIKHVFELDLAADGIQLYLLENLKIGVLCITAHNFKHPDEEDILKINQWGRRIYRPFITCNLPCEQRENHCCTKEIGIKNNTNPKQCNATCSECADALVLKIFYDKNNSGSFSEDYKIWKNEEACDKPCYAGFIRELLKGINFSHIIDDRMFTSCYFESEKADLLRENWPIYCSMPHPWAKKSEETQNIIDYWYRLCYADIGITCYSEKMKSELLQQITYDRWMGKSTFYAITKYSFLMFAQKGARNFGIADHFLQHYHSLILILLLQRSGLIKFSDDLNEMTDLLSEAEDEKNKIHANLSERLDAFRKKYILFVNKVWFDEITPQEQGIEMYELGKRVMELEKQKESIRNDIEEFYQFSKSKEQEKQRDLLDMLSEMGAILLPLGIWSTLISINLNTCFTIIGYVLLVFISSYFLRINEFKWSIKLVLGVNVLLATVHLVLTLIN